MGTCARTVLGVLVVAATATAGCDTNGILGDTEPGPGAPASVHFLPSQIVLDVGEVVDLATWIQNAHDVGTVTYHLHFNPDVLGFVPPAIEGPFMNEDGTNTVFLVSDPGGTGLLMVALARLGPEGIDGTGELSTLRFEALAPGVSSFALTSASVRDPEAQVLPSVFHLPQIHVTN